MRTRGRFGVLILAGLIAGCGDSRPEGPGSLGATVETGGAQVGAIVIQLNGTGIGAVTGTGSAEAFAEEASASAKRVVLVSATGGAMGMRIEVEDLSLPAPTATVVEAVDTDNEPITDLGGISVREFARAAAPAQAVGFSTRSSLATLPVLVEEAEDTLGLPESVTGLALPAAVSVFKYASPIVRITGTFFVASLFGIDLGLVEGLTIMVGVAALSFYSPGIPSGGLFVMAPLYQALGLPIEGIGILIALDIVPDMFITGSNVTADLAVAALLAQAHAEAD